MATPKKSELESDKALRAVVKDWNKLYIRTYGDEPHMEFRRVSTNALVGILDLRKVIAKRAPLKGIKAAEKAMKKATGRRK